MKTYRVWAKVTSYVYLDVEAESPEKAREIAEEADGGEFSRPKIDDGDWEIMSGIEEV